MPTSEVESIAPIIREVLALNPRSVLDLGAGCGKYGVLVREYLDGAHGRIQREDWKIRIDGVEGFHPYINDLHLAVYSNFNAENFLRAAEEYGPYEDYDLVLMIDSLEHLTKEAGEDFLDTLLANNKQVIVSVPMGQNFLPQGAVFGNELERHLGSWTYDDFRKRGGVCLHDKVCTVWSLKGKKV